MQKKIHKLKDHDSDDFHLIAVASHQSDYRLSWALNRQCAWHLTQIDDLVIKPRKESEEQHFSRFTFTDQLDRGFHLIANKSPGGFLMPSMSNIDFFIKITGDFTRQDIDHFIGKIKDIDFVIAAFLLENLKEKDKKKFLF